MDSFREGIRDGARYGAFYERTAGAFDQMTDTLGAMKSHVGVMFAGVAEGILPALQKALDSLGKIDFLAIGNGVASVLKGIGGAFQSGELAKMFGESLGLGVEFLANPGIWAKLGYVILKAFEPMFVGIQAGLEYALDQGVAAVSNKPFFKAIAGMLPGSQAAVLGKGWQADSFESIYARRKAEGVRFNLGTGEFGLEDVNAAADESLQRGLDTLKSNWQRFGTKLDAWGAQFATGGGSLGATGTRHLNFGSATGAGRLKASAVTSFEQMGFIGSLGRGFDVQQRIADNTARTAAGIEAMNGKLEMLEMTNA